MQIDWEGWLWTAAILAVLLSVPAAIIIRFGFQPVRTILGLIPIDDTIPRKVRTEVSRACEAAKIIGMDGPQAEAHLEQIAIAAICKAYTEHFGKLYEPKDNWPDAKCVVHGDIAVIRPIIGPDYDEDGIEPVNVRVIRETQIHDFKKAQGRVKTSAARAAHAFEIPNGQPDGYRKPISLTKPVPESVEHIKAGLAQMRQQVTPQSAPAPAPKTDSKSMSKKLATRAAPTRKQT